MSTHSLPSTMRSLLHDQQTQTLRLASVPLPEPSATQYLIKPHAVGLTTGELEWPRPEELRISNPGVEVVARVVTAPSPTSPFQPGDQVYGRVTYPQAGGAREFAVASDEELGLRPTSVSIAEAAAMPVGALTAWQALFEQFKLPPPDTDSTQTKPQTQLRILITAASGGTGIWAVQLAKLVGAHVVATCGPSNVDFVRGLGADDVLDYRTTSIQTWVHEDPSRKVDLVLDCAGTTALEQAWHAAKDGGHVLTIVPPADMVWKWVLDRPDGVSASVSGTFFIMHPSGEQLARIAQLADQGRVRAVVDSVWHFNDYQKAFDRLATGHTRGKVVLRIDDEE